MAWSNPFFGGSGQSGGGSGRSFFYRPSTGQSNQPAAPDQSRGRGAPERFELALPENQALHSLSQSGADVFAAAGRYPAQVAETPVSLFDNIARRTTGQSPVEMLGQIPGVSQAVGFLGEALERTGNFVPALMNSSAADLIRKFGDEADDFEIPEEYGERANGVPILGAIPGLNMLFSERKTIGELKAELEKRGFLADPETGQMRTWDRVIADLRNERISTFDFGYAAINDNPLVDLAGRLALDPTNALFLIPGANVAKAAQAGAKIAGAAADAATAARIVRPITAVNSNLVRTGLRAASMPAPIIAKEAAAVGDAANFTMRGWGSMLRDMIQYPTSAVLRSARSVGQRAVDPRGYLGLLEGPLTATTRLGRTGQIVSRTARGYTKSSAALSAGLATAGYTADRIDDALGGQTFFQDFHDFVLDVENDNPLSENSAWMVASAFSFPYGDLARAGKSRIAPETLRAFGHDFEPALARVAGFKGRDAVAKFHEAIGGPEAAQQLVVYLLKHRARRDIGDLPLTGKRVGSAPEAAVRAQWSDEALTARVATLLRENKVSGDDLVELFRDWHADQMGFRQVEGQRLVADPRSAPFDGTRALSDWKRYATVQSGPGAALQVLADGVMGLGLRNHLFAEAFSDSILPRLRQAKDSDIVPQELIRDVMTDHPALAISDPTGYWKNAALPDAAPLTWGSVRRKLADQSKNAPKLADELGEQRLLEQKAAADDAPTGIEDADARVARISEELEQHLAPDVLYHGSAQTDLTVLSARRTGQNLDNATSEFGAFLTPDRAEAQRYADMAGGGRVYETAARPQNPYRMSRSEFNHFQDIAHAADGSSLPGEAWAGRMEELKAEARSRRAELEAEGFDGILVPGSGRGAVAEVASFNDVPLSRYLDNDRSRALQAELSEALEQRSGVARARRMEEDATAFGPEAARILGKMDEQVPDLTLDPTTHFFDADQRVIAKEIERQLLEIDPTYTVKALPKNDVLVQMRQTDPALYQMVRSRTLLGEMLFDRGPVAPFTGFMKALVRPVRGDKQARAARQALYQRMIPFGAKPSTIDQWIGRMAEDVERLSVSPRGVTYHFYKDVSSLPAATINAFAREVFGPDSKIVKKYDGRFHDVLDQSSSAFWRSAREGTKLGGKRGSLHRAVERWGEVYREAPGLSAVSDVGRFVGKTGYHWFRFLADPRWHLLNLMERNFLGGAEDGIRKGSKQASAAGAFYQSGARRPVGAANKAAIDSAGRRLRAGKITQEHYNRLTQGLSVDPLIDSLDSGWYYGRGLSAWINRSFDERRIESTIDTLNGLREQNIAHLGTLSRRLRRDAEIDLQRAHQSYAEGRITQDDLARFEERAKLDLENSTADMAKMLDDQMYRFDQEGVKATLQDEALRLLDDQERVVLQPLLDVLYERNQQLWDDVNRLYHGNPQRSTIERIANSYWLYWPISYQIKAVKWLARTMLDGSFGHDNNALLAGRYALWQQQHEERMASNPAYAAMFKENPELWFTAQMILPMTPDGMGISLSRPVRLLASLTPFTSPDITTSDGRVIRKNGQWTDAATAADKEQNWLGLLNEYKQVQGPLSAATYLTDMGPIYTWHLLQDIDRELRPENEENQ